MAKISARGAKEVERIITMRSIYVYTSDGRVLWRLREGGNYKLLGRNITPDRWEAFKWEALGGKIQKRG